MTGRDATPCAETALSRSVDDTHRERQVHGTDAETDPGGARLTTWRFLIAAACLAMLLATPLPHIDSDAALFGKIAKTVLDSGEWLTFRHPVHPDWVVDKPPLSFWIMAISFWVGGQTDAALRLWHILLSFLLVFVVYRIARRDGSEEDALLAALLFATIQQVFYSTMAPQHDVPVTLFLALAFYAYLEYRREGRARWTLLAGLWMALAVLTKGILWLPVFIGIAAVDTCVAWRRGERPPWRVRHVLAGAFLFTLLAAPWFVIGVIRQGMPFVRVLLIDENSIGRLRHSFLGGGLVPLHGFLPMALAYVPILMVGMLPWTGLLPGAVREGWRSFRDGPPAVRLCAVWFALFFLVLSVSQGDRIMRYLFPCYPPLAVLAGRFLAAALRRQARLGAAALISLLTGLPMMAIAVWLARRASPFEMQFYTPMIVPVLVVLALALLAFAVLAAGGRTRQAIAVAALGSLLSYTVAYAMLMDRWERLWPWPVVGATVNRLYRTGDRMMVVGVYPAETNFAAYWVRARVEQVDEETFLQTWRRQRVFALLAPDLWTRLGERLQPVVLLRTPLGWGLVTNRDATQPEGRTPP